MGQANLINLVINIAGTASVVATAIFTAFAARSARISADAAKASADASQRTMEVAERPWLGVVVNETFVEYRVDRPVFLVTVKNFGSLPAYLIGHKISSCVAGAPPGLPAFTTVMDDAGVLNPGEGRVLSLPSEATISMEDWNRYRAAQTKLFVWFEISYRDPLLKLHRYAAIFAGEGTLTPPFKWWPNNDNYIYSD